MQGAKIILSISQSALLCSDEFLVGIIESQVLGSASLTHVFCASNGKRYQVPSSALRERRLYKAKCESTYNRQPYFPPAKMVT